MPSSVALDQSTVAVQLGGREAYVFFSFPHVAVDSKEGLGQIQRPGRAAISHACGALCAALGELKSNGVSGLSNTGAGLMVLSVLALHMGSLQHAHTQEASLRRDCWSGLLLASASEDLTSRFCAQPECPLDTMADVQTWTQPTWSTAR